MGHKNVVNRTQYEQEITELYKLWARLSRSQPSTVKKYYDTWYEIVVRELYTSGSIYLPKIGWFILKEKPNVAQKQIQPDGTYKYYEVPARDIPVFRPEEDFINDVNMKGITQSWRWRQKNKKISWRDKEREERAAEILELDYQPVDEIPITPKIRTLIHQSKFEEKLKEMRKQYEEKLFASINEVKNNGTEQE